MIQGLMEAWKAELTPNRQLTLQFLNGQSNAYLPSILTLLTFAYYI